MHWRKSFPSKFLQSGDLDQPLTVTVKRVVRESVGAGDAAELKPVLQFDENVKGVVLNQTRAEAVAAIAGSEDMDDWPSTRILLRQGTTRYQGKKVTCIEVAAPPSTRRVKPTSGAGGAGAAPVGLGEATEEPDDDEPF